MQYSISSFFRILVKSNQHFFMFSLFGEIKRERRAHLRSIYKSRYGLDLALGCVNERHWMDSAGWGTKEDINSALAPFWVQAKRCHCWAGAPSGLNELKRNSSKSWTTQKELEKEDEEYLAISSFVQQLSVFNVQAERINQPQEWTLLPSKDTINCQGQ